MYKPKNNHILKNELKLEIFNSKENSLQYFFAISGNTYPLRQVLKELEFSYKGGRYHKNYISQLCYKNIWNKSLYTKTIDTFDFHNTINIIKNRLQNINVIYDIGSDNLSDLDAEFTQNEINIDCKELTKHIYNEWFNNTRINNIHSNYDLEDSDISEIKYINNIIFTTITELSLFFKESFFNLSYFIYWFSNALETYLSTTQYDNIIPVNLGEPRCGKSFIALLLYFIHRNQNKKLTHICIFCKNDFAINDWISKIKEYIYPNTVNIIKYNKQSCISLKSRGVAKAGLFPPG